MGPRLSLSLRMRRADRAESYAGRQAQMDDRTALGFGAIAPSFRMEKGWLPKPFLASIRNNRLGSAAATGKTFPWNVEMTGSSGERTEEAVAAEYRVRWPHQEGIQSSDLNIFGCRFIAQSSCLSHFLARAGLHNDA